MRKSIELVMNDKQGGLVGSCRLKVSVTDELYTFSFDSVVGTEHSSSQDATRCPLKTEESFKLTSP